MVCDLKRFLPIFVTWMVRNCDFLVFSLQKISEASLKVKDPLYLQHLSCVGYDWVYICSMWQQLVAVHVYTEDDDRLICTEPWRTPSRLNVAFRWLRSTYSYCVVLLWQSGLQSVILCTLVVDIVSQLLLLWRIVM